jgi:hypothetical protein
MDPLTAVLKKLSNRTVITKRFQKFYPALAACCNERHPNFAFGQDVNALNFEAQSIAIDAYSLIQIFHSNANMINPNKHCHLNPFEGR